MESVCTIVREQFLLRQGSSDDAVNLFVDVQFGQTAALGVVGHTDGHRLGALGDRHCDLKELQREQQCTGRHVNSKEGVKGTTEELHHQVHFPSSMFKKC